MYNMSGVWYRILACGCIIMGLGVVCLLLSSFWNPRKRDRKCLTAGIIGLSFSIIYITFNMVVLLAPAIETFEGCFVSEKRASREAPPLPFTMEYCFSVDGQELLPFYLDIFSKKEIFPEDFQPGKQYIVYYEARTDIIVGIEKVSLDVSP